MATPKNQNNTFQQTRIALWGPSGAGKDWLFRSFAKELEHYNSLNREERDFHYELGELQPGDSAPMPLSAEPPLQIPATPDADDIHYIFERVPMIQDRAHQISAFRHDIMIHNDKGQDLVNSLNDPDSFESVYQTLTSAQNIFLVLGIPVDRSVAETVPTPAPSPAAGLDSSFMTEVKGYNQAQDPAASRQPAQPSTWRVREYVQFIRLLLAALGRTHRHNLAVCLTKSDLVMNYKGNPWDILQNRYSVELRNLLEVNRQWHNVQVFNTSAAGYIKRNGRSEANFSGGELLDPERWHPVNTAAPFFWIFEQIERANLPAKRLFGEDPQQIYCGYPPQR